jgi:YidC/Oxa1 family membrane protein insertase
MNPELQKIQAKYKGKKDEASLRKQQAENSAVYQKYGVNPAAGCLPLLISLPIMLALYQVIYNIPAYVNQVYDLYNGIAGQMQGISDFRTPLGDIVNTIKGMKLPAELTDPKSIIDILKKFNSSNWEAFRNAFAGILNNSAVTLNNGDSLSVAGTISEIQRVNGFFGLNIADSPGIKFPTIIIPILAGALQFVQGKQLQVKSKDNKDNPAASAANSMNVVMPIMSVFFCITFPIGVGLYWIAGSVFAIVQQFFVNKYMDRIDIDELVKKNASKANKRNAYLESKGISISDLAKKQTKNIESTVIEKSIDDDKSENESEENKTEKIAPTNPKSISDIANLLKNRNEKGDK